MPELLFTPANPQARLPEKVPTWLRKIMPDHDLVCRQHVSTDAEAGAKAQIWHAYAQRKRLLAGLASVAGGPKHKKKEALRRYLIAEAPKIAALHQAIRNGGQILQPGWRFTNHGIVQHALRLDMWSPLMGDIQMSWEDAVSGPDKSDCRRKIFRLQSVFDVARHRVALEAHRAIDPPHPRLLAAKGNGGHQEFQRCLRKHLPGKEVVLFADIPSYFPSLARRMVEDGVLLPKNVIRALLTEATPRPLGRSKPLRKVEPGERRCNLRSSTRAYAQWYSSEEWHSNEGHSYAPGSGGLFGVLPGLPLSALAAEVVMSPVIKAIEAAAPGVVVLVWVDDLVILLPSAEYEDAVRSALLNAVRDAICPQSFDRLQERIQSARPDEGFTILGTHVRLDGAEVVIAPPKHYWERLEIQIMSDLRHHPERFNDTVIRQRIMGHLNRFSGHWPSTLEAMRLMEEFTASPTSESAQTCATTPEFVVYTDGACAGSPGPGGWATVTLKGSRGRDVNSIVEHLKQTPQIRSGGEPLSDNARMELLAAVEGLRPLPDSSTVLVRCDATYVVENVDRLPHWRSAGFRRTCGKPVANRDLWIELAKQLERLTVEFAWVKAHSGNPYNELADRRARLATSRQTKGALRALAASAVSEFGTDDAA